MRSSASLAAAGLGALLSAGVCRAEILTYDADLGTLPTAEGWDAPGSFAAPMNVAGGTLSFGPTSVSGTMFWSPEPFETVDFSTTTVYVEATIRLTGADFGNFSGFRRGGFSLYLADDPGRYIIADLGSQAISLGNDNTRLSDPAMAFDMTSAFHTVRLEAGPAGARLLVDGVEHLKLSLGGGAGGGAQVNWGESTILANADLIEVRDAAFVPTPGVGAGLLLGLGATGGRRRRR